MEHRCGTRIPMSVTVRLVLPSRVISAQLENVSLSGAFVAVAECIPEQTRLVVELASQESDMTPPWRIPAHVVRETRTGIGIEWAAFAPCAVMSLLRRRSFQTDPYRSSGGSQWGRHEPLASRVEHC
jgi:hypothetical protein